jgi:aryl sulfotransferase
MAPIRYRSDDEDSGRWLDFEHRPGDIVISTRSKSGTTWMQMICALLVFGSPRLPAPLTELSPWLDWLVTPADEVYARLGAQRHRRFIKTHTPLDGLPLDPRVQYVVVARHPLDAVVSLYHHVGNLDRDRLAQLTGMPASAGKLRPLPPPTVWLRNWIERTPDPRQEPDSLPGFLLHARDAWSRRTEPNVTLVHYHDLSTDLAGQMRTLAGRLDLAVPEPAWPELVAAAGFDAMQARAVQLVPDGLGVIKDPVAFFRRGRSGAARELLDPADWARYAERVDAELEPELSAWLHRP